MSHDGYTKVAVSSPEPVCPSSRTSLVLRYSLAAREYPNLPSPRRASRATATVTTRAPRSRAGRGRVVVWL